MDYGYYDYGYDVGSAVATGVGAMFGIVIFAWIICIAIGVFSIICNWKVFKKAGKQGWESIIPIYNIVVLLQITELPMWYLALYLVPGVGALIANILIYLELAKKFGQSTGFGIGLALLNPIFMAILAFNKKYVYQASMPTNNTQVYNQPVYNQQPMYNQPQQPMYNQPQAPMMEQTVVPPVVEPVQPVESVQPQAQSNNCPSCGSPVNPGDRFCMNCGKQL